MDNSIIESFIRKQKVAFICSVDEDGFPNVKAMLKPRKMDGLGLIIIKQLKSLLENKRLPLSVLLTKRDFQK